MFIIGNVNISLTIKGISSNITGRSIPKPGDKAQLADQQSRLPNQQWAAVTLLTQKHPWRVHLYREA